MVAKGVRSKEAEMKRFTVQETAYLLKCLSISLSRDFERVEEVLLEELIQNPSQVYREIAEKHDYSEGYIRARIANELWKEFSSTFGKSIGKENFGKFIAEYAERIFAENPDLTQPPFLDNHLYGRSAELQALTSLTSQFQCVSIVGEINIGKTSLVSHWVERNRQKFEAVVWIDVIDAPKPIELLNNFIRKIQSQISDPAAQPGETFSETLHSLINLLQQRRCLLVVDAAEAMIKTPRLAANPYGENKDYSSFIRAISEQKHQSRLILVSRQEFIQVSQLKNSKHSATEMKLLGLAPEEAEKILVEHQLKDRPKFKTLIAQYHANPGLLVSVSKYIQTCFAGRTGAFLSCNTFLIPDEVSIEYLEQLSQLSEDERNLLFHLATQSESIEFSELAKTGKSASVLMKGVMRLTEMQWIERQEIKRGSESVAVFGLTPFIRTIVLSRPTQS